jgi:hypothetical protein
MLFCLISGQNGAGGGIRPTEWLTRVTAEMDDGATLPSSVIAGERRCSWADVRRRLVGSDR